MKWLFSRETKNYRYLIKAIVFSFLLNLVLFFILPVLSGMFLTYLHTPEITEAYNDVQYLQQEVSFGYILKFGYSMELALLFILGIIAHFFIVWTIHRRKSQT